ncbi:FecR family protein [Halobacteriovorax sp. GB3]|uniref:FecR family protein n=1 Tax=Halobacteriovorax sp. GB3 TaxID=2719615 RepID=UPI002362EE25|nr:FecR family protein [Halobacteriovorax sp. GB3]MDD0852262.1 FecR family protein [Halobacteriovorax sp. GB3]
MSFQQVFAAKDKGVAKAIILRGTVQAKVGEKVLTIKKGDWLPEGAIVNTEPKSFVKFLFIDKSQMNLGPSSQMIIDKFPRKKAGIITLMKGQLRSKVTKDYMDMDKSKSKLYIKTKTAAMGVRGTDFQVNFSPENENTTLITFEGAVAMGQIENAEQARSNVQDNLEKVVSNPNAVMVKQGTFSAVAPRAGNRPTLPTKMNPSQFETLKKNESGIVKEKVQSSSASKKTFRKPVPPGVNSKEFANSGSSIEKEMAKSLGSEMVKAVDKEISKELGAVANTPPPEGMKDTETGAYAPPAGGYIDLKTAQYIPPPPGSAFDPVSNTFIPPADFGRFDPSTGQYVNDKFDLTASGKFVNKPKEVIANDGKDGRAPASAEGDGPNLDGEKPLPEEAPPVIADGPIEPTINEEVEIDDFEPPQLPEDLACVDCIVEDRDDFIEETVNETIEKRARVKFIINSQ